MKTKPKVKTTNKISAKSQSGFDQVDFVVRQNIPDWVKKCAVSDCKTVKEFAYKYRKMDRFVQRGEDYEKAIMKTHNEQLKDFGYTCISHHDNVTGKFIAYIEI